MVYADMADKKKGTWRQKHPIEIIAAALIFALIGFHIYTAGFGQFPPLVQRSIHLGIALSLCYLFFTGTVGHSENAARPIRVALHTCIAVFVLFSSFYIGYHDERLTTGFLTEISSFEKFLGIGLTMAIIEAARRTTGLALPILAAMTIGYTIFGDAIPGKWGHPGFSNEYLFEHLYLSGEGIWGMVTGLSATLIAAFIILGAFLLSTGAADGFMDLSVAIAGRSMGGAAKVATFSSALFGTLNGAAVANVATTGNFTIPAMKRLGYRPEFAAAVEACASSGGQITPPIMGAGAFVMAELLGVPYLEVVYAAIIPAFLFYTCIWFSIDIEARRSSLKMFDISEVPSLREVLTWNKTGAIGVTAVVIMASLFTGKTPTLAAFYGICAIIGLFLLQGKFDRVAWKNKFEKLMEGARLSAKGIITVLPLLICAQISLSLIGLTGVGVKLSEQIISVGVGYGMFPGLVLTLIVALVLGMGMPTTAAYLLAAAVTVPALSELGINPLAAHFFVFYGALLSALTPPVCTAVFTAAVIAQVHWFPVAITAIRLAAMKYALPFFFIYRPEILMTGSPIQIFWVLVVGVAAAIVFAFGFGGYIRRPIPILARGAFILTGCSMIQGGVISNTIATFVLIALITMKYLTHKRGGSR
jgi:TRAP transporter 4TM/12TM fusion protein